jgi:hypothetical protein
LIFTATTRSAEAGAPTLPQRTSRPARAIFALFFALVTIKAAAYWVGSAIQHPGDPLSTIVIYRGKDIESFPIVRNMGQFGVGEPVLYEGHNAGVLTERMIPWIGHAVLFRALGPSGFIVADLVLTPLRFVLLAWLLRLCGIRHTVAIAVSAVLTCAAIDDFGEVFPRLAGIPIRFWGLRLPRPYISELFLLLAAIGALVALNRLRERVPVPAWTWMLAGGALALLFQSDLYSAIGLALAFVGMLTSQLLRGNTDRMRLLRGAAIAVGAALVFSITGVFQSYLTNPQGLIRLGLFPVSRWRPPVIDAPSWYAATAALAALAWLLGRDPTQASARRATALSSGRWFAVAVCIGALAAMPATTLLSGRAIELYHFRDAFTRYFSLAVLVVGLHACEAVWQRWRGRAPRPDVAGLSSLGGRYAIVLPAAVACALFAWRFASSNPTRADHMRSDIRDLKGLTDYREPFVDLVRELSRDRYDGDLVLGTFDQQVWSWWTTFRGGYSYLADACTTNAEDAELERRPTQLARLLGMTRTGFLEFARREDVMIFWMSCAKYQATRAYSFAPLDDYIEADKRLISTTPGYLNFTVALPLSQQARLGRLFDATDVREMNRLDLIVLTRDESLLPLSPPDSDFDLAFENRVFRLWKRRAVADVGAATTHFCPGRIQRCPTAGVRYDRAFAAGGLRNHHCVGVRAAIVSGGRNDVHLG